ncbi:MAG: hypothetical protein AMXMBFR49_28850 [Chlorobiota bacterium]
MELLNRQRELLNTIGLAKPGNVLKVHYTNLGFGNESKPFHFSVNITEAGTALETVFLVPISTKFFSQRHFVKLNLAKNSNLRETEGEELDQESYALIAKTRQVKVGKLFEPPTSDLRGSLFEEKRREILKVRKIYLQAQFTKKQRGGSK